MNSITSINSISFSLKPRSAGNIASLCLFAFLFLSLFVGFGCSFLGGGKPETNQVNETASTPPSVKLPSFSILSPSDGQSISFTDETGTIELTVSTQNLVLKSPGGVAKVGEGHFKITVDGGESITLISKSRIIPELASGEHTIKVELLNNDRKSYTGQSKTVTFTLVKDKSADVYEPQEYVVTIAQLTIEPQLLTVKRTDMVKFVNDAIIPIAVVSRTGSSTYDNFNTKTIQKGASSTVTMNTAGEFEYYSTGRPDIKGRIIVTE